MHIRTLSCIDTAQRLRFAENKKRAHERVGQTLQSVARNAEDSLLRSEAAASSCSCKSFTWFRGRCSPPFFLFPSSLSPSFSFVAHSDSDESVPARTRRRRISSSLYPLHISIPVDCLARFPLSLNTARKIPPHLNTTYNPILILAVNDIICL